MISRLLKPFVSRIGSRRHKSFGLFFVTSFGSRAVGIACQLLQVPIALKALGAEAFGVWMTLLSLAIFMQFADLGVGIGVQNRLAEAFGTAENAKARRLFGSAFGFLLALSCVLGVMLVPIAWLLDVKRLFGLTEPSVVAQAPYAVAAIVASFCFNLPFGLAQRLAYSLQKGWMHNLSQACGNLAALGTLMIAVQFHANLSVLILATTVPTLLANAILLVALMRKLGWLSVGGFEFEFQTLRGLLGLGAHFSVQQVLATVLFSMPAIVISSALGAAAVTPYNLAQRLFNLFAVVQNAFMLPLWPAYSEALAKGEFDWMRRTFRRSIAATFGFSIMPMALGAFFAPQIIRIWVGHSTDDVIPSTSLIWTLFAWNCLVFLQQPFGYLLAGVSEIRRLTAYMAVNAAAAVPLMFILVRNMRQEGVMLGLILAFLPFNFLGSVLETLRFLRKIGGASEGAGTSQNTEAAVFDSSNMYPEILRVGTKSGQAPED